MPPDTREAPQQHNYASLLSVACGKIIGNVLSEMKVDDWQSVNLVDALLALYGRFECREPATKSHSKQGNYKWFLPLAVTKRNDSGCFGGGSRKEELSLRLGGVGHRGFAQGNALWLRH